MPASLQALFLDISQPENVIISLNSRMLILWICNSGRKKNMKTWISWRKIAHTPRPHELFYQ